MRPPRRSAELDRGAQGLPIGEELNSSPIGRLSRPVPGIVPGLGHTHRGLCRECRGVDAPASRSGSRTPARRPRSSGFDRYSSAVYLGSPEKAYAQRPWASGADGLESFTPSAFEADDDARPLAVAVLVVGPGLTPSTSTVSIFVFVIVKPQIVDMFPAIFTVYFGRGRHLATGA